MFKFNLTQRQEDNIRNLLESVANGGYIKEIDQGIFHSWWNLENKDQRKIHGPAMWKRTNEIWSEVLQKGGWKRHVYLQVISIPGRYFFMYGQPGSIHYVCNLAKDPVVTASENA